MSLILVDSYSETYDGICFYWNSDGCGTAHSFVGKAGNIVNCKFYLKKIGNPTGNMIAKLYAHSGTFGVSSIPTGVVLATSDAIDISILPTSFNLIIFNFTGVEQYTLVADTYYCIAIEPVAGASLDDSNIVYVGSDIVNLLHSGNASDINVVPPYLPYPNAEVIFYVYAEETRYPFVTLSVEKRIKSLTVQKLQTGLGIEKRLTDLDIQKK